MSADPTYAALDVLRTAQPGGLTVDDMVIRQVADFISNGAGGGTSDACYVVYQFELLAEGGETANEAPPFTAIEAVGGDCDLTTLPTVSFNPEGGANVTVNYDEQLKDQLLLPIGYGICAVVVLASPSGAPDGQATVTVSDPNGTNRGGTLAVDNPTQIISPPFPIFSGAYGTQSRFVVSASTAATQGSWLVTIQLRFLQYTLTTYDKTIVD